MVVGDFGPKYTRAIAYHLHSSDVVYFPAIQRHFKKSIVNFGRGGI